MEFRYHFNYPKNGARSATITIVYQKKNVYLLNDGIKIDNFKAVNVKTVSGK